MTLVSRTGGAGWAYLLSCCEFDGCAARQQRQAVQCMGRQLCSAAVFGFWGGRHGRSCRQLWCVQWALEELHTRSCCCSFYIRWPLCAPVRLFWPLAEILVAVLQLFKLLGQPHAFFRRQAEFGLASRANGQCACWLLCRGCLVVCADGALCWSRLWLVCEYRWRWHAYNLVRGCHLGEVSCHCRWLLFEVCLMLMMVHPLGSFVTNSNGELCNHM